MKKSQGTFLITAILLFALTLTGCRSSRNATGEGHGSTRARKQRNEFIVPLAQYPEGISTITAKSTIALSYNSLSATVKGKLRMRRDEAIQMTFTALGVMEIAFIEFTPQNICLVDRVNKRYVVLDYSSELLQNIGINFNAMQALFWNRIFIPGEVTPWTDLDAFTFTGEKNRRVIVPTNQSALQCRFYTDSEGKLLQQTNLKLQHYSSTWQYGDFETFDTCTLPTTYGVSFSGSSRSIGANISLSNISTTDTTWKSGTNLSNYKQVNLEQLMSMLNMLR